MYYINQKCGIKYRFVAYRNAKISNGIIHIEVQYKKRCKFHRLTMFVKSISDNNIQIPLR